MDSGSMSLSLSELFSLRTRHTLESHFKIPIAREGNVRDRVIHACVTLELYLNIWISTSEGYYGKPWFLLIMVQDKILYWLQK